MSERIRPFSPFVSFSGGGAPQNGRIMLQLLVTLFKLLSMLSHLTGMHSWHDHWRLRLTTASHQVLRNGICRLSCTRLLTVTIAGKNPFPNPNHSEPIIYPCKLDEISMLSPRCPVPPSPWFFSSSHHRTPGYTLHSCSQPY